MSKHLKSWEVYSGQADYSRDWQCRNCSWDYLAEKSEDKYRQIVGIEFIESGEYSLVGLKNYKVIVECLHCFEKFWFHTTQDFINSYNNLAKDTNLLPNWPK